MNNFPKMKFNKTPQRQQWWRLKVIGAFGSIFFLLKEINNGIKEWNGSRGSRNYYWQQFR